jgi:hypothetical protein
MDVTAIVDVVIVKDRFSTFMLDSNSGMLGAESVVND